MEDNKKDSLSSSSRLSDNGIFLFPYGVDADSCADAIEFILEANLEKDPPYDHLTLVINSEGGSCVDGFALLDIMQGSKLPVWTTGIGLLASMGLLIFMGGKKGKRILTPNTLIMSHQYSAGFWGKEHELVSVKKRNKLMSSIIINHYRKHTKIKKLKDIRKYLLPKSDVWLSAEEALKLGICDKIKYLKTQ